MCENFGKMCRALLYLILVGNIYAYDCEPEYYFPRVYPKDYEKHYVTPKPQPNISVLDPNEEMWKIGSYIPPISSKADEGDDQEEARAPPDGAEFFNDSLDQHFEPIEDAGHWRGDDIGKELSNWLHETNEIGGMIGVKFGVRRCRTLHDKLAKE